MSKIARKCISEKAEHADKAMDCGGCDSVETDVSKENTECEHCPIDEAVMKETERDCSKADKGNKDDHKILKMDNLGAVTCIIATDSKAVGVCRCALDLCLEEAKERSKEANEVWKKEIDRILQEMDKDGFGCVLKV